MRSNKRLTVTPAALPALPQRNSPYPQHLPLVPDEVKAALWHAAGNVTQAAALLHTSPARVGSLLRKDPALAEERKLAAELVVDRAESVLLEAMTDQDDKMRRDDAARFVLTHGGRIRGWSKDGGAVNLQFGTQAAAGAVAIRWQSEE